jgi:hypothetical protein
MARRESRDRMTIGAAVQSLAKRATFFPSGSDGRSSGRQTWRREWNWETNILHLSGFSFTPKLKRSFISTDYSTKGPPVLDYANSVAA